MGASDCMARSSDASSAPGRERKTRRMLAKSRNGGSLRERDLRNSVFPIASDDGRDGTANGPPHSRARGHHGVRGLLCSGEFGTARTEGYRVLLTSATQPEFQRLWLRGDGKSPLRGKITEEIQRKSVMDEARLNYSTVPTGNSVWPPQLTATKDATSEFMAIGYDIAPGCNPAGDGADNACERILSGIVPTTTCGYRRVASGWSDSPPS